MPVYNPPSTIQNPILNGNAIVNGDVTITQISAPAAPASVATHGAAGSTHITYGYSAVDANGFETPVTNTTAFLTANATLDGTNYTIITAPALPVGAVSMKLYRTATNGTTPTTVGVIATGLAAGAITNDQAIAATKFFVSAIYPGTNQTSGVIIAGRSKVSTLITPNFYMDRDDFFALNGSGSGTAATAFGSQTQWFVRSVTAGTWHWTQQATVTPNIGIVLFGNSTATQNDGIAIAKNLGTTGSAYGVLGNLAGWDSYWIFKLAQTTSTRIRIGFCKLNTDNQLPTSIVWFGLRYDTAAGFSDTNFMFSTVLTTGAAQETAQDSLIAADTNWHTLRMRSLVAQTVLVSLDGGPEFSFTTNLNVSSVMGPFMQIVSDTAADATVNLDFFSFYMDGLAR